MKKGGKHTGKIHRGDKMHMKSKKGGGEGKTTHKGNELPSICDADCYSPSDEYKGGGSGHNEKHS